MASRAGASCTDSGIRTQRDEHEVSWGRFCRRRKWHWLSWWVPSRRWKISWDPIVADEMLKKMHTILRGTFAWVPLKLFCQMISRNTYSWTVRDWLRMVSWEKESKHTVSVQVTQNETWDRKVHHTQEEMTQWTLVHLAKARARKAKASTESAKAKEKDNTDRTGTRARTRTRTRLNVGTKVHIARLQTNKHTTVGTDRNESESGTKREVPIRDSVPARPFQIVQCPSKSLPEPSQNFHKSTQHRHNRLLRERR